MHDTIETTETPLLAERLAAAARLFAAASVEGLPLPKAADVMAYWHLEHVRIMVPADAFDCWADWLDVTLNATKREYSRTVTGVKGGLLIAITARIEVAP